MEMKKNALPILLSAAFLLVSCGISDIVSGSQAIGQVSDNKTSISEVETWQEDSSDILASDVHFSKYDLNADFGSNDTSIVLSDGGITVTGSGASADGGVVTISAAGVYVVSGAINDGQIIVDVSKNDKVRLVLNGVNITCSSSAPIWIKSSDKTVITLADGTDNYLTDSKAYTIKNTDDEPNSCLFSKDDLTINGTGRLTVTGNYNNGIGAKDDLKIISGSVTVTAKNNGLKGNDSVSIAGGTINITASDDGIKTTNDTDEDKGYIYIRDGSISIVSGDDALQAEQAITVTSGEITVKAGGKAVNCKGIVDIAEGCIVK